MGSLVPALREPVFEHMCDKCIAAFHASDPVSGLETTLNALETGFLWSEGVHMPPGDPPCRAGPLEPGPKVSFI